MNPALRLGTRASALAVAQTLLVARQLESVGVRVELVPMESPGDADASPLPGRAQEGIFTSRLHSALVAGEIDAAVHSFKDLPCEPATGLVVAAVPRREDPRDTLVTRAASVADLPGGARVGTCSVRRAAWLARVRPDLTILPVRGPIDSRIARLEQGDFDAIILASAGLNRLGCPVPGRVTIAVDDLVPAPAQGALALECRSEDLTTRRLLGRVDHRATHASAIAERTVLATIDPTDATAVGAVATARGGVLTLLADLSSPDGTDRRVLRARVSLGDRPLQSARQLGEAVASRLLGLPRMEAVS